MIFVDVDNAASGMTEKLFETLQGSAQSLKSQHLRELLKDEARRSHRISHQFSVPKCMASVDKYMTLYNFLYDLYDTYMI